MMRKLGLAALFLALGSVAALAADFNGKWTGEVQGRMGTQTLTFDFHVDGSTLTGKITTPRGDSDITDGKVDGDNISFTQKLSFNGNDITINYSGKADGDTIKFTRQMGDRPASEFVAKRGDAAPAAAAPPQ
jgi:opacity protein-like surface antigen